jgi:acyl carrier protein
MRFGPLRTLKPWGFILGPDCNNHRRGPAGPLLFGAGCLEGIAPNARASGASDERSTRIGVDTNTIDRDQLTEQVIEVICKEGMIDREKVTPDATIESLDLKSIDIVMILTAIEEKFDVYIPMDGSFQDAKDVKTLITALVDHVVAEKSGKAAG